jgi:ribosomal protein L22
MAEETKTTQTTEEVKQVENKEVKETKKPAVAKENKKENLKREFALVNGINISMSRKEAGHICDMIRNKNIDDAIKMVDEVIVFKRPVRMTSREYPHQHGKGVAGACYPIEAAKHFAILLKNLKANALHHELELEKVVIFCKANGASRPYRRGGARFKRTHVMLKLIKKEEKKQDKTKNMKSKIKGEKK